MLSMKTASSTNAEKPARMAHSMGASSESASLARLSSGCWKSPADSSETCLTVRVAVDAVVASAELMAGGGYWRIVIPGDGFCEIDSEAVRSLNADDESMPASAKESESSGYRVLF